MALSLGTPPRSVADEAMGMVRDLRTIIQMWTATEMERRGMDWRQHNRPGYDVPVVDTDALAQNLQKVAFSAGEINAHVGRINEGLHQFGAKVRGISENAAKAGNQYAAIGADKGSYWNCADIAEYKWAVKRELYKMSGQVAAFQMAAEGVFGALWLRHICPPHRCEDEGSYDYDPFVMRQPPEDTSTSGETSPRPPSNQTTTTTGKPGA
ncbi:MAG: hypothetical protein CR217_13125 [Beijerinckiaceae bacterium]|nr:MAG: hypothetical protein CR217_13125 [Beijerinckiaceae bacterium]